MINLKDRTLKAIISTYMAKAVAMVLGFILPVIIVRHLSVQEYGIYKLINSLMLVFMVLTSFGLSAVVGRFIPELLVDKKYHHINKLFLFSFLIRFCSTLFFICLLFFCRNIFFTFFNFPSIFIDMFIPISIIIFANLVNGIIGPPYLNALMDQPILNCNNICYGILKLILFSIVLHYNYGIRGIIYAWITIEAFSLFYYSFFAIIKYFKFKALKVFDNVSFENKRFVKYGFYHFLSSNLVIFHDLLVDNFFISKYLSIEMVGIYSLACAIIGFANIADPSITLKGILNTVIVRKYSEKKSVNVLYQAYNFVNKISLFFYIPALVGLFFLGDKLIVYVFRSDYLESAQVLCYLLPFFIFVPLNRGVSLVINLLEKNHIVILCGVSSLYNLIMDIILVRYFGIAGIAFASGSALLLLYLLYFIAINQYIKLKFPLITFMKIILNTIPMAIFLYVSKTYISNLFMLFLVIIAGASIYFFMSYINKIFDHDERDIINMIIKRKVWIF